MNGKIFVIAGTYDQFNIFRRTLAGTMIEENIDVRLNDIVYVHSDNLYGYEDIWGYKVGTWQQRKDIDVICMMLLACRSSIDNFIEVEL